MNCCRRSRTKTIDIICDSNPNKHVDTVINIHNNHIYRMTDILNNLTPRFSDTYLIPPPSSPVESTGIPVIPNSIPGSVSPTFILNPIELAEIEQFGISLTPIHINPSDNTKLHTLSPKNLSPKNLSPRTHTSSTSVVSGSSDMDLTPRLYSMRINSPSNMGQVSSPGLSPRIIYSVPINLPTLSINNTKPPLYPTF